MIGCR